MAAEREGPMKARGTVDPPPSSSPSLEFPVTDSVPPIPAASPSSPWVSYKEQVARLASRIVEAQRPIRILNAIKWEAQHEERFFKSRFREVPNVTPEAYASIELGFEPRAKAEEFEEIARDIEGDLGPDDDIGRILLATALEYRDVVRMLAARGTPLFYAYSRRLYGSPKDVFPDGKTTLRDLGRLLYGIFSRVDGGRLGGSFERVHDAHRGAAILAERFTQYFGEEPVRVEVDDGILADAAAGSDYVKLRSGARFSDRDLDILEVHEGWVHVATSINGQKQPVAKWLAKGPPRTTTVQEGLAALVELFTFRTYPRRARRLNDRVIAVDKAEDGANFVEVFEWFRTEGYDEQECFDMTKRTFRGGVIDGGAPFTKDACYCKGIVLNFAFIQAAIAQNRSELIPYLFVGKVAHEDVPILHRHVGDGVVKPPHYLPPMFRDLNALAIWMAFSSFFSRLEADETEKYYERMFAKT
jgi:uncharacterized protein (TIGR02421 family)